VFEYRVFLLGKYLLKYILIGFILSLIIFLLYSWINNYKQKTSFIEQKNLDLGMYNATYQISEPNLTTIYAQKSLYSNQNEIIFEQINGIVSDLHYKEIKFSSQQGVFNKITNKLHFPNQVIISSPQGLNITANKAFYNLNKQVIKAIDQVNVKDYMGEITSRNLNFNLAKQIYDFSGDVIAANDENHVIRSQKIYINASKKQIEVLESPQYEDQDITLNAKKFVGFYQEDQEKKWQLQKIIAYHNVKIISKNTVIHANQAEYYPDKRECLIWGDVKLNRDNNVIKGQKLIYNVTTDSFKIISKQEYKVNLKFKKESQ
jgi:LPS export ABC transporter protein LptC